jgi:hypothetical protein
MNKYIKFCLTYIFLSMIISACQPTPEQLMEPLNETLAAIPTQTAYPTYTPINTFTPYPTYTIVPTYTPWIKIVTPTHTSTPLYTPTITPTKTNTPNPLTKDKAPGYYLVGTEIAPGVWRSLGSADDCYWSVNSKTGDIISNHFGMAGGTMYIPASAFEVRLEAECGMWTYIGQ